MTPSPAAPGIHLVLEAVSATTGISIARILSRCREADMSLARLMAYHCIKQTTSLSLVEIGMEIGGRDPATVREGLARFHDLLARQPSLVERTNATIAIIQAIAMRGLNAPARVDGGQLAERILRQAQVERAATLVSTRDVIAMAHRTVQLVQACELAAEFLSVLATDAPTLADTHAALAETLAALGYVTFEEQENTDGKAQKI